VVATLLRDPNRPSQGLPVVADYPNGLKVGVIQDSSEFFVVCAVNDYPAEVLKKLMTTFMQKFNNIHTKNVIQSASALSLSKKSEKVAPINDLMQQYEDPKSRDLVSNLNNVMDETRNVLEQNIEEACLRGDTIEDIDVTSGEIMESSFKFKSDAKAVKQKACMNMWLMRIAGFLVVVVLVIILLAVLGVFDTGDD